MKEMVCNLWQNIIINKGQEDEIWIGQNLIIMENPPIKHLK